MGTQHAQHDAAAAAAQDEEVRDEDAAASDARPDEQSPDAAQTQSERLDPRNAPSFEEPSPSRMKGPNPEYSRNDYNGPDRGLPYEPPPPNVQNAREAKRKQPG